MKFIPQTNNQYMFNEKGEVFSLKQKRFLKSSNQQYSVIYEYGRRNIRQEALRNLYMFLEIDTKPIPNYKQYHITKHGNVYSLTTNCWIKPFNDKDGYKRLALVNDEGVRVKERICRLVAITYIDNPNNFPIVNHKDEIRDNDFVDNLEWVTYSQNQIHSKTWLKRQRDERGRFA